MKKILIFIENLKISLKAIKSNILRTILTILIIAIGIMALTGIMTAIESLKSTLSDEFSSLGTNSFSINKVYSNRNYHGRKVQSTAIKYSEAIAFKQKYNFPATVSISINCSEYSTIKRNEKKTTPTISVIGVDENYLRTNSREIDKGREFLNSEVLSGENLVIIGSDLKDKLFDKKENPEGKDILIGNIKYRIIAVLKSLGSSMDGQGDNICFIPLNNARQYYSTQNSDFKISVMPNNINLIDLAVDEAEGLFRTIRNLTVQDENNFEIRKSDSLLKMLLENMKTLSVAATIIGLLTLLGAAVGLMNIMLVSVAERTHEIGIRKAIGANNKTIKQQFLLEAVLIGQLGGILGVVLGIIAGNIVAVLTKSNMVFPIFWVIFGVVICFIVSVVCGYLPAVKASKLDPIIALHYE